METINALKSQEYRSEIVIVNNAAMKIGVHISIQDIDFTSCETKKTFHEKEGGRNKQNEDNIEVL